ncbi:unnamed protein product [Blepharisma stoltei]|uniref:30S ribosomal protein S15, chloroplastic n=1 Tax=Blepharisma stoltei TaxID=1481888 RepID=A0AAU9J3U5_9CILI|nr:unnamed protein product [Blepharisma stoltei]
MNSINRYQLIFYSVKRLSHIIMFIRLNRVLSSFIPARSFISGTQMKSTERAREARLMRKLEGKSFVYPNEETVGFRGRQPWSPVDKRPLPSGYRGHLEAVLDEANDIVKDAYSMHNASLNEIRSARIREIIAKWGNHKKDNGDAACLVCILTEHIISLSQHMRANHNDTSAFLKLRYRLDQRRRAMMYLSRTNHHKYLEVIQELGLRDIKYPHHKEHKNIITYR